MIRGKDVRLKVCGMRDPENIVEVGERHPDYMGFIFYRKSPRYVGEEFIVPDGLPRTVQRVGVFVNETTEAMLEIAKKYSLSALQLHGMETPEQCEALRSGGYKVIKAFAVDSAFDFDKIVPYKAVVDFFMFDTKGAYYGGNAASFDWQLLRQYDQSLPFFLSGGLSPENVDSIVSLLDMNLYALDVNSGVESAPGIKSLARLDAFKDALEQSN
ncbi:MAG TPA: phosphoribosylanthranilate isomerase [Cyclobacteriaceae bacterium]|nr:phosphoribosylanthranilate isomerase [Cyclobacteriaceae bacterium]